MKIQNKKSITKYNRIQESPLSSKWYKPIPWFEWYYVINQHWKIISFWKKSQKWAVLTTKPQTFIKPWIKTSKNSSKKKFAAVTLYDWLNKKKFYVARLVAHLFMWYDLNDKTKQILFKDWNPQNCDVNNLQIWTISDRTMQWMKKKYRYE